MNFIPIESRGGEFSVSFGDAGIVVTPADQEDLEIANVAQSAANKAFQQDYSPSLGEPLTFAAQVVASLIRGKITQTPPPGRGELEQAQSSKPKRSRKKK